MGSLMVVIAASAVAFAYPFEIIVLVFVIIAVAILPILFLLSLNLIDRICGRTSSNVPLQLNALSGNNLLQDEPAAEGIAFERDALR